MADGFKCVVCESIWTGATRCHCSGCHMTMSAPSTFEKHQRWIEDKLVCLNPSDVGLELRDGVWKSPAMTPEQRAMAFGGSYGG